MNEPGVQDAATVIKQTVVRRLRRTMFDSRPAGAIRWARGRVRKHSQPFSGRWQVPRRGWWAKGRAKSRGWTQQRRNPPAKAGDETGRLHTRGRVLFRCNPGTGYPSRPHHRKDMVGIHHSHSEENQWLYRSQRCGTGDRITLDPAAGDRSNDPWMLTMPCRKGEIYPHGGDRLSVEVTGRRIADRLAVIPGVTLWQDGDREKCFLFPVELFPAVAEIVQPRRRRKCHLTDEQKAKLADMGAVYRFSTVS